MSEYHMALEAQLHVARRERDAARSTLNMLRALLDQPRPPDSYYVNGFADQYEVLTEFFNEELPAALKVLLAEPNADLGGGDTDGYPELRETVRQAVTGLRNPSRTDADVDRWADQLETALGIEPVVLSHIRQAPSRARRGNQFYKPTNYAGDPSFLTLCGEPATGHDMSYAETRWPKNLVYVTCEKCLTLRTPEPPKET